MLNKNKVSIIVPVYNVEKYLEQCLVSIINQTYKNIEIILVDDGSTDMCPQKCEEWAQKDDRILVFHKSNGGLSDARNYGINASSGEYLMFVDSDDWIDLTMVEKMVNAIESDKTDMAICQFVMVYPDGGTQKSIDDIFENTTLSKKEATNLLLEDNRISNHVWRKLYKKEYFDCYFPVEKNYEDLYVTWKLINNCSKISLLDNPLYFYRQNSNGIISSLNLKNLNDFLDGVLLCSNNIEKLYPEYKTKIENYRFEKMLHIYCLSCELNDKINCTKVKQFRKKIIKYLNEIELSNIAGKKNKIKFIFMKYFHKVQFKHKRLLKTIKQNINFIKKYRKNNEKTFWILGTPEYGNLGDHLLLKGEIEFISKFFPKYKIRTISIDDIDKLNVFYAKYLIKKDDICAIQAGGNMGTLYPWIHSRQEHIIEIMKNKKMFVFPQTYFYSTDKYGVELLEKSKKIYEKSKILVFVRDEKSYEFLKLNFSDTRIYLVPDIALILENKNSSLKRNGALYCLRTDSESTIEVKNRDYTYKTVAKYYNDIEVCDTHVYVPLKPEKADLEIRKLMNKFSASKLVITDRLHGMIMAVITHTPCIVLNSRSHKIMGVYNWIKKIPYIKMVKDIGDLEKTIIELNNMNDFDVNIDMNNYWKMMCEKINNVSEDF